MSRFDAAMIRCTDSQKGFYGVAVSYIRGVESVSVTAIPMRARKVVSESSGMVVEFETYDFVVKSSDLVFNSLRITPRRGDKIVNGNSTYEVFTPGNEQHYEYSVVNQTVIRIHTKLVSST